MKRWSSAGRKIWIAVVFSIIVAFFSVNNLEAAAAKPLKMNPGQTKKLTVSASHKKARWSSSNRSVVTVNKNGKIRARVPGAATITAKTGRRSRRFLVKVVKPRLNQSRLTLKVGGTKKLKIKNALGKITWSSNSKAAKVDARGKITAVKKGRATITAKLYGKKYQCRISVKEANQKNSDEAGYQIQITVRGKNFDAVLYKNAAAQAIIKKFPMTISMDDLHSNEKYHYLPERLPVSAENVSVIKKGDLMLYGSDCLVLFYKSFNTSFRYTRIGYVNNPDGLAAALGSGTARVTFQMR